MKAKKNFPWILILAALLIALGFILKVTGLIGPELIADNGRFAMGYFAAGDFAMGVFAAGTFSFGIFSAGIFSFGIFSIGIFNVGLYATGFFLWAWRKNYLKAKEMRMEEEY